jgi:hypothetical protein
MNIYQFANELERMGAVQRRRFRRGPAPMRRGQAPAYSGAPRWQEPPLGANDGAVFGLTPAWWLSIFLVGAIGGAWAQTELVHRRSR